ncbi:hypothetical protein GGI17_006651 [Coemansia sp. S146]|nr:hypothetical protein GGI17_006651 [Coemansia sp. S146]
MQSLSAFQLLPSHIVKLIVDHVAFSSRYVYAGFDDDEIGDGTYTKLQVPLLWVCHNFRAFVYERFCKRYRLEIYSNSEKPYGTPEFWPYCHRNPANPTHRIAKELTFNFDAWAVYSGKALAQMSMAPFEGCPFPQVCVLMITLYINPKANDEDCHHLPVVTKDYPLETTANTTASVQRLKQMAPGINEVDVEVLLGDMEEVLLANCSAHDMELAITPGSAPLVMYMDLEPLRRLVRIDIEIDGCTDAIVPMVRRNIQTLQVLAVSVGGLAGITGLIQNTGVGNYLEYPCLHALKLYEFNDNAPFRGNVALFAYLDMKLDKSLMAVISKHDVFTPTSHLKLHCVIIDSLERHTSIERSEFPTYLQFVLSIGPGTPVREYGVPQFGNFLLLATPRHCELASIQVLEITRTPVDLWDVLALLKLLPLLSDLTTLPPRLGTMPTGITKAKLRAHVISTYSPMAKRFRRWCFWDSRYGGYTDIVMCVGLVALVCPNFDYVAPRPNKLKQYGEKLEETIASRRFKKHAPRLRCLLFQIP